MATSAPQNRAVLIGLPLWRCLYWRRERGGDAGQGQADVSADGNTSKPVARHAGDHVGAVVELRTHSTIGTEILNVTDHPGDAPLALGSLLMHDAQPFRTHRMWLVDTEQLLRALRREHIGDAD